MAKSHLLPPQAVIERISTAIDCLGRDIHSIWQRVHTTPEIGYEEKIASSSLAGWLQKRNFAVSAGVAEMPTAFLAQHGEGEPALVFMAEYDALPDVGHACGHSLSGVASVLAGAALAACAPAGRCIVLGTPAEEAVVPNAGGKLRCIEAGLFTGVAASLMAHAGNKSVLRVPVLARAVLNLDWHGKAAHAGAAPHEGKNALSAALLSLTACNAMYQQLEGENRINAIITKGGTLVNTIPEHAAASLQLRSPTRALLQSLIDKTLCCAHSGALATGCRVESSMPSPPVADLRHNSTLLGVYAAALDKLGIAYEQEAPNMCISTDAGNVSYELPCIHPFFFIGCGKDVPLHSKAFAQGCASDRAYAEMLGAAKALALTGYSILTQADLRSAMHTEFSTDSV